MEIISLAGLAAAMTVLALTPGPGVFATVASAISSGVPKTLGLICGLVTGDICYLLFAIFGLSMIAQSVGEFFIVIKIGAGIYLVYLGFRLIFQPSSQRGAPHQTPSAGKTYISGLFITLSNPKVILFYCGFLPNFMDLPALTPMEIALTVLTVATVVTSVLCGYAILAAKASKALGEKNKGRALQNTAGGLMIATGIKVALN